SFPRSGSCRTPLRSPSSASARPLRSRFRAARPREIRPIRAAGAARARPSRRCRARGLQGKPGSTSSRHSSCSLFCANPSGRQHPLPHQVYPGRSARGTLLRTPAPAEPRNGSCFRPGEAQEGDGDGRRAHIRRPTALSWSARGEHDARSVSMKSAIVRLAAAVAACAAASATAQPPNAEAPMPDDTRRTETAGAAAENPFFAPSPLPLQYPPFDRIRDEHFAPALERGMAEHLAEVESIASNPEPPTFENTIVALERSGRLLERTATVFYNLVGADTNDMRQALQAEFAPKLSAHEDAIRLNADLFARIETLYRSRDSLGLGPEAVRLIERYYVDFVRAGAQLSEEDKARLREINEEIARLSTQFTQNVLAEVNASAVVVDDRASLDGLPPALIEAAAQAAAERGLDGKYLIALQNTTGQPPNAYLHDRALRRRIHEASIARGSRGNEYDNRGIISRVM